MRVEFVSGDTYRRACRRQGWLSHLANKPGREAVQVLLPALDEETVDEEELAYRRQWVLDWDREGREHEMRKKRDR